MDMFPGNNYCLWRIGLESIGLVRNGVQLGTVNFVVVEIIREMES